MSARIFRVRVAKMHVGKKVALTSSPRYKAFIRSRDHVLEEILAKYTRASDLMLDQVRRQSLAIAADSHVQGLISSDARRISKQFEQRMGPWFEVAAAHTAFLADGLRRTAYVFSYLGQAEAIGRATGQKTRADLHKHHVIQARNSPHPRGGDIGQRIHLGYLKLQHELSRAIFNAVLLELPITEVRARIEKVFPSRTRAKFPTVMAPMKEADQSKFEAPVSFSSGVIDDEDWEHAMSDYEARYLPGNRTPNDKVLYGPTDDEEGGQVYTRYQWEVEQELTQDFVQKVRDGDDEAARANGIDDFQWIALAHDTLCESCEWRDGLTTTEIEAKLDGEHSDDRLDDSVPPLHPHCYCRLAPMSDAIPEETPPDFGGFDEWLEQKAKEKA